MYYFYCPNCGKEDEVNMLPKGTVGNLRDGFGMPISHYECSNCHNLDAGFMRERIGDDDEKKYYQHVIRMYQNIRGFNKTIETIEYYKNKACEVIKHKCDKCEAAQEHNGQLWCAFDTVNRFIEWDNTYNK